MYEVVGSYPTFHIQQATAVALLNAFSLIYEANMQQQHHKRSSRACCLEPLFTIRDANMPQHKPLRSLARVDVFLC